MITYLIGAGSSFYAIPLVKNLNNRLIALINDIANTEINPNAFQAYDIIKNTSIDETKSNLLSDAEWLVKEAGDNSIDTLAKRYSDLNDQINLIRIKSTLTAYLIFEQAISESKTLSEASRKIDHRYIDFIAKTSRPKDGLVKINNQINIISWNYDIQWELAYFKYYPHYSIYEIQDLMNFYPSTGGIEKKEEDIFNQFTLIKLNGTAGIFQYPRQKTPFSLNRNLNILSKEEVATEALVAYLFTKGKHLGIETGLRFAFEKIHNSFNTIEIAKKSIAQSEKLIILGYSFPEFNREYDKILLRMLSTSNEILIQDTPGSSERIKEIIESIFDDGKAPNIKFIHNLDFFYIPPLEY